MHCEAQLSPQNEGSSERIKRCRFCNGNKVIKRGQRKTQNRGKIQRYYCQDCKKRFVTNNGFFRMRNDPLKITFSLDAYYKGMSLRKLQDNLTVFQANNCHHTTILRWLRKYSKLMGNYVDGLKVNNSNAITFDEMEYKTKGKQGFFIDVMDMRTRYILSSGYYDRRGMNEMREVLRKAKQKSKNKTTDFYTDGLKIYPRALRHEYNVSKLRKEYQHHLTISTDKAFNWKIERLHNSIRERTKVMRQFKSLESAKSIMKGYEIYYNFCRKHQGIKCYPYELATNVKLGKNKWLDLIRLSNNN